MSELHIAARTAMHQAAVVLANLADARNPTLDVEDMALIQARLAGMNRAFVETGLLAAPAQELSALPELPKPDTHCYDDDTQSDVWSHSAEQTRAYGLLCRQQPTSDTARLDRLEAWRLNSLAKGFDGDTFQLTVDRPIREQLDAIQAQAGDAKGGA